MEREKAIKYLQTMDAEIAEIIAKIDGVERSILAYLVPYPSNDDFVKPCDHYWVCTDIDEFDYYLDPDAEIISINEFITDYK